MPNPVIYFTCSFFSSLLFKSQFACDNDRKSVKALFALPIWYRAIFASKIANKNCLINGGGGGGDVLGVGAQNFPFTRNANDDDPFHTPNTD